MFPSGGPLLPGSYSSSCPMTPFFFRNKAPVLTDFYFVKAIFYWRIEWEIIEVENFQPAVVLMQIKVGEGYIALSPNFRANEDDFGRLYSTF